MHNRDDLKTITLVFGLALLAACNGDISDVHDEQTAVRPPVGPLEVYGDTDWQAARCYLGTHYYDAARSVCRIDIPGKGKCTGFLIGPDLVLTNEHCIATADEAAGSTFRFDYEEAACGNGAPSHVDYTGAELLIARIDGHDASLVRITAGDWPGTRPWLAIHRQQPVAGEVIYIPQHPSGGRKVIAVDSDDDYDNDPAMSPDLPPGSEGLGHLLTLTPGSLSSSPWYRLDTDNGSSGSPVIRSADDSVVALHARPGNRGVWMGELLPTIRPFLEAEAAAVLYFDQNKGTVALDGNTTLHLKDADLAGNGSQQLTLTTTAGDQETVILAETSAANGHFTVTIPLVFAPASVNDGTIQTAHMATITTSYADQDDGTGQTVDLITQVYCDGRDHRFWEKRIDDVAFSQITLTPTTEEPNGYRACITTVDQLPVDPTGMTTLPIDDNESVSVPLDLPEPIRLWSRSWDHIEVWRYGHISLGNAGSGNYGDLEAFFTSPRIAPAAGPWKLGTDGSVGWQRLSNRLVVTWQQLNQWSTATRSDLQLECFDDGRLRFTILALDDIATISPGISDGIYPGKDESGFDWSAAGACNAPPIIDDLVADPDQITSTTTTLTASATDPEGGTLDYDWWLSDGPNGAAPTIDDQGDRAVVTFDRAGDYRFALRVSDPEGLQTMDVVDVVVEQRAETMSLVP